MEKEDIKILAENFHIHDASVPRYFEWLQTLLCEVCKYQKKNMGIKYSEQLKD